MSVPDLNIEYDPYAAGCPTVGAFMESNAFVRCIIGPVGSAKSTGSVFELLSRACEQRPSRDGLRRSRWAVIRNTYGELRDTTRATFDEWLNKDNHELLGKWHETSFTFNMSFGDVRSEVLFRALDRPDHIKKLLSLELTGAWINEAKEVPWAIVDALKARVSRFPSQKDGGASWSGIWMDTNAPDTDHPIYRVFEEERPPGYALFRQPSALSPNAENIRNLSRCWKAPDELQGRSREKAVEQQEERLARGEHEDPCVCYYPRLVAGAPKDWVDVYVRAQYGAVREGNPVFPEYQDQLHCVEFPALGGPIGVGMDFGLTPAAVLGQRDPKDGQLQIIDEFVTSDIGAVTFARELRRKLNTEYAGRDVRGWGDPAGAQRNQVDERTPFDVVNAAGLPIDPAPTNDVMLRLEAVKGMLRRLTILGRPSLVIHPRCKVLRKAMMVGYCYRRIRTSGAERFRDEPDKNDFSHVADGLQYLAVGQGEDTRAVHGAGPGRRVKLQFKVRRAMGG